MEEGNCNTSGQSSFIMNHKQHMCMYTYYIAFHKSWLCLWHEVNYTHVRTSIAGMFKEERWTREIGGGKVDLDVVLSGSLACYMCWRRNIKNSEKLQSVRVLFYATEDVTFSEGCFCIKQPLYTLQMHPNFVILVHVQPNNSYAGSFQQVIWN